MLHNDSHYYTRRAEDELERAARATEPRAIAAHYELSMAYRERAKALVAGLKPLR